MRRSLLALALAGALAFGCAPAQAAKCYIREYGAIAQAPTQPAQIGLEPGITDQVTSDFSGGAVQSSTFNTATSVIRLWCDTQASFLVGTNPAATAANAPIAALTTEFIGVTPNSAMKLSVHTNP